MFDISNGCNTCEPFAATFPDNKHVNMENNLREVPMNNNNILGLNENKTNTLNNNYNELVRNNANNQVRNNTNNQVSNNVNTVNSVSSGNVSASSNVSAGNVNPLNSVSANSNVNAGNNVSAGNKIGNELFQNGVPSIEQRKEMKKYVVLGLVIVAALACNEAVKFMIEQQLKFNEGNNMYYLGYAVAASLLAIVIYKMTN